MSACGVDGKVICTALAYAWSHGGALCLGDKQHSSSCIQPVCVACRSDDDGALKKKPKRSVRNAGGCARTSGTATGWPAGVRRRRDDGLMATATLPEKAAHKWSRPRETNA